MTTAKERARELRNTYCTHDPTEGCDRASECERCLASALEDAYRSGYRDAVQITEPSPDENEAAFAAGRAAGRAELEPLVNAAKKLVAAMDERAAKVRAWQELATARLAGMSDEEGARARDRLDGQPMVFDIGDVANEIADAVRALARTEGGTP